MCCVGTQPCNSFIQDTGTESESYLIQRTRLSHSNFPDKINVQYSSMRPKLNTNIQTSTSMYEAGQIDSDLSHHTMSPDSIISYDMFDLVSAGPTKDTFPLSFNSDTWNRDVSQIESTAMIRLPSEESLPASLSNSVSSNESTYVLSGNFDNGTNLNITECQNMIPLIGNQNIRNFNYPEQISMCQKNATCKDGFHDMSNILSDDFFLGMKHEINFFSDTSPYDSKLVLNHPLWENNNSQNSPDILPRYDEISLSPMIGDSICFSSGVQASSPRGNSDLDENFDFSLDDDMRKMDVRSSPIGGKDLIKTENIPNIVFNANKSDETLKSMKRSAIDSENVRTHPLYHNAVPQEDGFYHCPWENDPGSNCQHKPEKLKCNYDKCVDSHLKPYQCKVASCKGLSFSSTACLLRHEREAHAMHGHGDKPFLCPFKGCDRGIPGKGFPRRWNLCDHIRRVHKDPISSLIQSSENSEFSIESNTLGISESTNCTKRRKRGTKYSAQSTFKAVSGPLIVKKPKKLNVIERYKEKQLFLLETVKKLQDPKQHGNMALLRNANECIEVMVEATQIINSPSSVTEKGG